MHPLRLVLAVALALGTVETTKAVVIAQIRGVDFGVGRALVTNMSWWLLWVPLALVVFWIARRVPPRRGTARWVMVHGAACTVLTLVHIGASAVFVHAGALLPPGVVNTVAVQFRTLLAGYLLTDVVTYGVILASHTVHVSMERLRAAESQRARLAVAALHTEAERARLETLMTRARLRALRSELDPHFLFNSLNSVAALVRRGDTEAAIRTTARVGELLRTTLEGREDPEVTLGEEVDVLLLYLDIERVRFGDRLVAQVEVPSELRDALVPSLTLQPLVENAIRHGVARTRDPVRVDVTARRGGARLRLSVRDTGPGPGAAGGEDGGAGIGLGNLRERLAALYGPAARLDLCAPPEGGAETVVLLPLRLSESAALVS